MVLSRTLRALCVTSLLTAAAAPDLAAQRTPLTSAALDSLVPPVPDRFLSDETQVLTAAEQATLRDRLTSFKRTWGVDIGVAILPSLNGRDAVETGVQIIRRWGVGSQAPIGDPRRDRGALLLLVPKETNASGRGVCRVATTTGAEGVLTDATSGSACRAQTEQWKARAYAEGIAGVITAVETALTKDLTPVAGEAPAPTVAVSGETAAAPAAATVTQKRGLSDATILLVLFLGGGSLGLLIYWHGAAQRREEEAQAERAERLARDLAARRREEQEARNREYREAAARTPQPPRSSSFTSTPTPVSPRRKTPSSGVDLTPLTPLLFDDDSSSRRSSSPSTDSSPSYGYDSSPSYDNSSSFGDSGSSGGGGGGSDW